MLLEFVPLESEKLTWHRLRAILNRKIEYWEDYLARERSHTFDRGVPATSVSQTPYNSCFCVFK